jgi:hypothetical protein
MHLVCVNYDFELVWTRVEVRGIEPLASTLRT